MPSATVRTSGFDSREIFRPIVPVYDLLNRVLSLGIDRKWRRKAAGAVRGARVLDLATGTGDLALELAHQNRPTVFGADILPEMLAVAQRKARACNALIPLCAAAGESLPFTGESFDAVTIAFGIRNYRDRNSGLREMKRVLRPGGELAILEFSIPSNSFLRSLYVFYFRRLLPLIGGLISRNRDSYTYLPESVLAWPESPDFALEIARAGFVNVRHEPLTFGIATLFTATRAV